MKTREIGWVVLCALGLAACSESAVPTPQVVASLVAASPTRITVVAGSDLLEPPGVITVDPKGNLLAGIAVTFSASDRPRRPVVVRSGADGVARLSSWVAPQAVGSSVIFATIAGAPSLSFDLETTPGPLASIVKLSGDRQIGFAMEALPVDPGVRLADAFGNAIAGVRVDFVVDSGSGSLRTSAAVSNIGGIAGAERWTLGPVGRQVLSATVVGFGSAVFSALAVEPPRCRASHHLALGTPFSGQLTFADCLDDENRSFQVFDFPVIGSEVRFNLTSSDFDTQLTIADVDGTPVAMNDNAGPGTTNSVIKALLASRPMTAVVLGVRPGATGAFSIDYTPWSAFNDCDAIFTMRGIQVERTVNSGPCPGITVPTDRFQIYVRAGEQLSVQIEDFTYSDWQAQLFDSAGKPVAKSAPAGAYGELTALTFTAAADGFYALTIVCGDSNGRYVLTIK